MKTTIVLDNDDVMITCPHCNNESWDHEEQPRHKLSEYNLIEWLEDDNKGNEVSKMECIHCKGLFNLIWDYKEKDVIK